MRVGMTNASRANANQDIVGSDGRSINLLLFERSIDGCESNSFHFW